jgi:uncharacterized membrane protein YozB (DUF420 family)
VPTGSIVILSLKIAVAAVTVILIAALVALACGNRRLHGRLNLVFFILTLAAVLGFEFVIRFFDPTVFDYFRAHPELNSALNVHLCFAVPALLLMPAMLYTGLKGLRSAHLVLASLFSVAWAGTFVTGIFFLPLGPPS